MNNQLKEQIKNFKNVEKFMEFASNDEQLKLEVDERIYNEDNIYEAFSGMHPQAILEALQNTDLDADYFYINDDKNIIPFKESTYDEIVDIILEEL